VPSNPENIHYKSTAIWMEIAILVVGFVGLLAVSFCCTLNLYLNLLMPNDDYNGRTAPLTPKCCILYIYSTNIGTEYFKHGVYCPFFALQNAVCFIILTYLVPVPAPKG